MGGTGDTNDTLPQRPVINIGGTAQHAGSASPGGKVAGQGHLTRVGVPGTGEASGSVGTEQGRAQLARGLTVIVESSDSEFVCHYVACDLG